MVTQIQGFRLSPQQSHLWKLQQDSHAYQAQCAISIEGNLNRAALEEALQRVINRHEILRTTFHRRPGIKIPIQVVGNSLLPDLSFTDLSDLKELAQQAWIEQQLKDQRSVQFDYANGPVLRFALLAISKRHHLLLMNLPALCADASSLKILVHEISRCYGCALVGEKLTDEALQYADLSEWQNELFESEEGAAGIDYWRRQDFSELLATRLPFEKTSNSEAEFEPRFITLPPHPDLLARIKSLVEKYETSVSTFILACWQILLWRLDGRSDNVIGTSFECRKYEELADVPGLFAKYLPLRCRLEDALRFEQLLKQTDEQRSEIERWQEWFSWSQNRETLFTPLCFDFNEWSVKYSAGEVAFSIDKQYVCSDRFIVKLSCNEKDDCLTTQINYDANVCRVEDMTLLAMQFETLLEMVVAAPEAAIGRLNIFTRAERETLVIDFNSTAAEFPRHLCLHQLFEEQAARSKDGPAVIYKDSFLSYSELDRRANQLARHLHSLGAGPDRLVGLYLERTPEMIVALLATLKAGGAYLPLDPGYPPERLAYMLQDAQVSVLLTTREMRKRLDVKVAHVVCLDEDWDILGQENDALPDEVKPNHLAYVIYTSGSTGRPKGVMITHRGAVNYLSWATSAYRVADGAGAPVHSSIGFDLTVTSIFTPLLSGRSVILVAEETGLHGLKDLLHRDGNLSLVKITPAHLGVLNQSLAHDEVLGAARALVIGGEALLGESLEFWKQHAPQTRIINEYGPTETVVGCCVYEVAAGQTQPGAVPIGRPIANTQIYVLNEEGQPVSIGIVGEIFIGGEGVARGYLNHPELTAEKFIPDAISGEKGRRLYRTGDLGKFLAEGGIEYVGRADAQVKVRGYRVELGEIEAVIVEQMGVREAVVIVRDDGAGDKALLGYVVLKEDAEHGVEEIKGELRKRLPEYMIPVALIRLESLPLTANGKIDRNALPEYHADEFAAGSAWDQASRTPIEEIVAGAWAEVLRLRNVGVNANFFELGGHSLLALRMVSRLQSAFQIELPVDSVFEAPTVSSLAALIENIIRAGEGQTLRVIQPVSRDEALPLSFAQQRLWIQDQFNPATAEYNIPLAVRVDGKFDVRAFEQTFSEVIRRHEVLRTSFPRSGDLPVQAIAQAESVSVPVINLCALPKTSRESEALRQAVEEAALPFDLARGPLLRSRILRLDEEQHYVLFTMHHIISDGWSMGVLVRELAVLYDAFSTGKAAPLPDLPVQYADFAYWQRQWLEGEVEESQLAYWKQQLAGSQPVLRLRTDRPRPALRTSQGATKSLSLSHTLSEGVKQLSRREGVTQFMTLLAAFQILLRHYTQEDDMLIGTDVANRNSREIEGLIGFFVNQLVFRTNLSGDPNFRDLLGRVRKTCLGAYTNQDLPFEKLVEVLKPERSSNYSPLFQVKFIFQDAVEGSLEIPGGVLTPLDFNQATTNLDLVMSVEDNGHTLDTSLLYATDLFNEGTITRMLEEFEALLGLITTHPEIKLSRLTEALHEFGGQQQRAKEEQFREARRSLFRNIKQKAGNGNGQSNEPEQTTPEVDKQTLSDHLMLI